MFENNDLKINISDFQKVFAVTAVMMQTILTFALSNTQDEKTAAFIGTFYVLVKFTAPLFIFAIVYNMVKTSQHLSYLEFRAICALDDGLFMALSRCPTRKTLY
jgi:hypothetical protein